MKFINIADPCLINSFTLFLRYMLFGSCHQIGFGVSALESLLLGEGVERVIGYIGSDPENQEDTDRKASFQTVQFT